MQVTSIAECSKGSILQYFRPSLSYHFPISPLFCRIFNGRLRQVLLYFRLRQFNAVKNWYQFLTAREGLILILKDFIPIFLTPRERNTLVVKLYVAIVHILHIDKIPQKLLHFAFDSNSSRTTIVLLTLKEIPMFYCWNFWDETYNA